ncbi:AIR carboxylase family protein [Thermosipho sp. 1074]|nr:AIR carboxylase family protein [Thermosipho sp. 1074]
MASKTLKPVIGVPVKSEDFLVFYLVNYIV